MTRSVFLFFFVALFIVAPASALVLGHGAAYLQLLFPLLTYGVGGIIGAMKP